jgi:hypothetical protein
MMMRSYFFSLRAGIFAAVATAAIAGCANNAVTSTVPGGTYADGVLYAHPHYAITREMAARVAPAGTEYVPYQGGVVLTAPKIYLIFWGYKKYGDPDKLQPLLETYTKNMGGSSHNNIETQYYEKSGGSDVYITNPANQYGGSWSDKSTIPKSPSDAQIAAESLRGVAHFGYDPEGVYVVATAHKHSEDGFGSHWCSYHSNTYYDKKLVPYANLPYMPDAGKSCGADIITPPSDENGLDEGMTILAGHEYGESITDPDPFTAWYGVPGEIADPCAWHNIANDTFGSLSFTAQPMVSDATASCVQGYPSS